MMHKQTFLSSPFLQQLYTLPSPSHVQVRGLHVLALGLSRWGSDSLRHSLVTLGYRGGYHGNFKTGAESQLWTQWWDAEAKDAE
ncbi:MAG: hypothetical protein Q9180_003280 [Flavoplaca navasiana]